MKVVVTGGSGQLGSLVLERLAADRKIKKIVSLDLVPPAVPSSRIEWRIADVRDPGLERYMESADALVHLAFSNAQRRPSEESYAVNVEGSRKIFAAAAQHEVRRIVYASSVAAYGPLKDPAQVVDESTPRSRNPARSLAAHKFEVEEHLDAFEASHPELEVVRLRPGVLFGRRMSLVNPALLRKRLLPVFGDAKSPIVWDEDVADAVVLALHSRVKGAFNLVASDPIGGPELARLAGFLPLVVPRVAASAATRATGMLAPIFGDKRLDTGFVDAAEIDAVVSSSRARQELGWNPRHATSAEVAIAFGAAAQRTTDRRIAWFFSIAPRFAKAVAGQAAFSEANGDKLVLHVDVTGPSGGDFCLVLEEGKITAKPGVARPPNSTVALSAETLLELLAGRADVSTAVISGRVEVRGEPLGSLLLSGIIEGFRRMTGTEGVRGRVARGLSKWFDQGPRR